MRLEVDGDADTTCLYEVVEGANQELLCASGSAGPPDHWFFQLANGSGTFDNFEFYTK